MAELHELPWDPVAPERLPSLLEGMGRRWWVAGGWGLDLFLGHQTRPHADTDVQVLREDQRRVHEHLTSHGWELFQADPPGHLVPWTGSALAPDVHDIWCRRGPGRRWAMQLMVADAADGC